MRTSSLASSPPGSEATGTAALIRRQLTARYVLGLGLIASLAILAQVLLQRTLSTQEADSQVINVAGRQRMLSQKITKAALAAATVTEREQRAGRLDELRVATQQWITAHQGLQFGSEALGLTHENSATVEAAFTDLNPHFEAMVTASEALLADPDSIAARQALDMLIEQEVLFLPKMDALVVQYTAEAQAKVQRLRRIEFMLLAFTLILLAIEAVFIFRPAVRHAAQALADRDAALASTENALRRERWFTAFQTRFMTAVSHEFRTPLSVIRGASDLLEAHGSRLPHEKRGQYFERIRQHVDALSRVLENIGDVHEGHDHPVEVHPVDPLASARSLCLAFEDQAHRLHIDEAAGNVCVQANEALLRRILHILIDNALRYTASDVTITLDVEGKDASLIVADQGPGIAPDDLPHVFDPFYRGVGTENQRGLGLGLSIAQSAAVAMRGGLSVESENGQGARFRLRLPVDDDHMEG